MVIRNYHCLNSASRVLISTCSAPLVKREINVSLFDLDLQIPLTYNPRLVKVDPHAKNHGQMSNGSNGSANGHAHTRTIPNVLSSLLCYDNECVVVYCLGRKNSTEIQAKLHDEWCNYD